MKKTGLPSRRQSSAANSHANSHANNQAYGDAPSAAGEPMRLFDYQQADFEQLAQDVLKQAKLLGATAAVAEVSESSGLGVTVRKGQVETIEQTRDKGLGITVHVGHRRGHASTSDFSPQALQRTVQAAYDIARITGEDPFAGLPDEDRLARDADARSLGLFDPWQIPVDEVIELALQIDMQRDDWYSSSRSASRLADPKAVGRYAAQRALARLGARKLSTRKVPVLYEAPLALGLLGSFVQATSGSALYRKTTFLVDSLGKRIFPEHVLIHEDPFVHGGMGSGPFDDEGVATAARDVVRDGVLQGYFLSSYSARKLGMETTGNAGGSHNLRLSSSLTRKGDDFEAMLRKLGTGLLLTEVMGQGVNYVTGDYSRGASGFWVENGVIQYPVEEITVAGNLADMIKSIVAVGADTIGRGT